MGSSTNDRGYRYPLGGDDFEPRQWIETLATDVDDDVETLDSSLAPVAKSGAYDDLTGRPTLGNSASRNVGTTSGTVAAGDDARIVAATPNTRQVIAGAGLTGGGDLSANRTLAVSYGTTEGTAAQGNDSRITGAVQSSLVDAKGDLLAGTADNTVARLAAPADGRVLVADSTQTAGWAAAAMGNVVPLNVANGGEDGTTTGWHQRLGQPIESTDAVPASVVQGTRAILLTKTTVASVTPLTGWNIAGTGFATSAVGTQLSVTPGETWTVFASLSSDTVTDNAVVALVWADASGTVLSRTTSTAVALSATPKRYGVTGIAPANAARLGIEIGRSSATALTTFRCLIDAVSVHRGAGGLWSPPGVPVPPLGIRTNPSNLAVMQAFNPSTGAWQDLASGSGVVFGTTAGTATEGNDSRVVNAVQNTRQVATGSGLTGGGDLSANRTLAVDFSAVATAAQGTKADSAVQPTIIDAKGDLLVGTANDTVARLPVSGVAGRVLTEDPAEAGGMKWAAPAGSTTTRWALRLPGTSGNFVTTPNPINYTGLTELDVRWVGSFTTLGSGYQSLCHVYNGSTDTFLFAANNTNVFVEFAGSPRPQVFWAHGGVITTDTIIGLRLVWRADNGSAVPDVRIFTSADEGATWTLRQTTTASMPTALTPATIALSIGSNAGGSAQLHTGLVLTSSIRRNGTLVAEYDARDGIPPRYTDPYNNLWTVNGSAWSGRKGI